MNNIEPKPVKERSNLDLLELVCQLHGRALDFPSKEMHDAYIEARQEMEKRLQEIDLPESKESGWIQVTERLPEEKEVGKKVLVWRRLNESQSSLNPSIYNTNMVKHCDTDALWQPLPPAPQEKGE